MILILYIIGIIICVVMAGVCITEENYIFVVVYSIVALGLLKKLNERRKKKGKLMVEE